MFLPQPGDYNRAALARYVPLESVKRKDSAGILVHQEPAIDRDSRSLRANGGPFSAMVAYSGKSHDPVWLGAFSVLRRCKDRRFPRTKKAAGAFALRPPGLK
jgi:hypothetical protein